MKIPQNEKIVVKYFNSIENKDLKYVITEKITAKGRVFTRYDYKNGDYIRGKKQELPTELADL